MADKAIDSVKKSVSSFWNYASGYATQMFTKDDLESEAVIVGADGHPQPLDRLQAQLHALAADPETFLADPDPRDDVNWDTWCPGDLDKRQGEISDLMVNNAAVREYYKEFVPDKVANSTNSGS